MLGNTKERKDKNEFMRDLTFDSLLTQKKRKRQRARSHSNFCCSSIAIVGNKVDVKPFFH